MESERKEDGENKKERKIERSKERSKEIRREEGERKREIVKGNTKERITCLIVLSGLA